MEETPANFENVETVASQLLCVRVMPKCEATKQNVEAKNGFESKGREKQRETA